MHKLGNSVLFSKNSGILYIGGRKNIIYVCGIRKEGNKIPKLIIMLGKNVLIESLYKIKE